MREMGEQVGHCRWLGKCQDPAAAKTWFLIVPNAWPLPLTFARTVMCCAEAAASGPIGT